MFLIHGKIYPLPRGWGLYRPALGEIGKGENVDAPSCQKGRIRDKLEKEAGEAIGEVGFFFGWTRDAR